MKFKIGDKVRILPSVVNIGVDKSEIGKTTTIKKIYSPTDIVIVSSSKEFTWIVHEEHIEFFAIPGQQLLFAFMEDGE